MIAFGLQDANQLLINPRLSADEQSGTRLLQRELEKQLGPSGYFFISTSGTARAAGESTKLIALSVDAVLNAARRFQSYFEATEADHWGLVLPHFHVAGLSVYARAHVAGSDVFTRGWNVAGLQNWLETHHIAFVSLVPAQVFDLVQAKVRCPSSVKKIFVGAGSLNAELRRQTEQLGWPVAETYGMTETCSMIAVRAAGELFKVMPGVNVRREEVLTIQCDSLLTAYAQQKNGRIEISHHKSGDWYFTEDLAEITADQAGVYLRLCGRRYEYIKILVEGVSLPELREKLEMVASGMKMNPLHLALLALESEREGFRLILVAEETVAPDQVSSLVQIFNQQCRPYEKITQTERVPVIPRTELGKLKADELKAIIKL